MELKQTYPLPPDRLLTRKEAAEYLNVTVACLAKWAYTHRQKLPMVKLGKNIVRYRKCDLDAFIEKHTQSFPDLPKQ